MHSSAPQTVEPEKRMADIKGFDEAETEALKSFWKRLFDLLNLNPASTSSNGTDAADDDLKPIIAKHGSKRYAEALWTFTTLEDPDYAVICFIRARNLKVENAVKMFVECLQWRIEANVDSIVAKGERGFLLQEGYDSDAFTRQISSGKTFLQGWSKSGAPVCYVFARLHKSSEQNAEVMADYTIYAMENIRFFTANLRSKLTLIFDLTGFGLSNMDWKTVLQFTKSLEANYPESLQLIVIHNAPWVFQGVWRILGPMLDPVVRSKILFTKTNADILDHIEKRYVLEEHGGSSTWKMSYKPPDLTIPEPDQSRKAELLAQRDKLVAMYIVATDRWLKDNSPRNTELRSYIALMMRVQGLSLDPFIRGRTFYHREGSVLPDGLCGFLSQSGQADWKYVGHSRSRPQVLDKIEAMKARFKAEGVEYPEIDFEL